MTSTGKKQEQVEEEDEAQVWKHMYRFTESFSLKCAIEIGIPDVIHKHKNSMTLSELAGKLSIHSLNMDRFHRLMNYLVHMKLFSTSTNDAGEKIYGLTTASECLVKGKEESLASYALLQLHIEEIPIWYHLIDGIEGIKTPWVACHGGSYFDKAAEDIELNRLFNDAMTDYTNRMVSALMQGVASEGVLKGVRSLVDVGGNSGVVAKGIADTFPHVKCAVFDLPQIIETVHRDPKIEFVAGDMFATVPNANAVLMKSTLHNFSDEDCIKILSKCREAVNSSEGKVIIVEIIVDEENMAEFTSARLCMDMEMMMMGGKERTKEEWENLLGKTGFSRHKIIPIMAMESIIVAYP